MRRWWDHPARTGVLGILGVSGVALLEPRILLYAFCALLGLLVSFHVLVLAALVVALGSEVLVKKPVQGALLVVAALAWTAVAVSGATSDWGVGRLLADALLRAVGRASTAATLALLLLPTIPLWVVGLRRLREPWTRLGERWPCVRDVALPALVAGVGVAGAVCHYAAAVAPEVGRFEVGATARLEAPVRGEVVGYVDTRLTIAGKKKAHLVLRDRPDSRGLVQVVVSGERRAIERLAAARGPVTVSGLIQQGVGAGIGAKLRAAGSPPSPAIVRLDTRSRASTERRKAFGIFGVALVAALGLHGLAVYRQIKA